VRWRGRVVPARRQSCPRKETAQGCQGEVTRSKLRSSVEHPRHLTDQESRGAEARAAPANRYTERCANYAMWSIGTPATARAVGHTARSVVAVPLDRSTAAPRSEAASTVAICPVPCRSCQGGLVALKASRAKRVPVNRAPLGVSTPPVRYTPPPPRGVGWDDANSADEAPPKDGSVQRRQRVRGAAPAGRPNCSRRTEDRDRAAAAIIEQCAGACRVLLAGVQTAIGSAMSVR